MDIDRDLDNSRNNKMYFHQIEQHKKFERKLKNKKTSTSFTEKEVDFSDFLFVLDGYEGVFYTAYIILIPYITGTIFLYFFVANGDFGNYKLIGTDTFLVVWMVGYEVAGAIALMSIFISFLGHKSEIRVYK